MAIDKRKTQAAELVHAGKMTMKQVAETVGVDRRTLTRWRTTDEFKAALAELGQVEIDAAKAVLIRHATKAAQTLVAALDSTGRGSVIARVRAAVEVLNRTAGDPGRSEINIGVGQQQGVLLPNDFDEFLEWKERGKQ